MKKKIIYLIAIICMVALLSTVVYAADSYEVKISPASASAKNGEEITVTFTLKNITIDPGIGAITGKIEYDKTVFDKITSANIKSGNGWGSVVYNDQESTGSEGAFAVERSAGDTIKEDNVLFEVTFSVLDNAKAGATQIKLSELSASNLEDDIEIGVQTGSVTIGASSSDPTPTPTPKAATPTPTPKATGAVTPTPTPRATGAVTPTPTPTSGNNTTGNNTTGNNATGNNTTGNNTTGNNTTGNNTTGNKVVLPYAGSEDIIVPVILIIALIGTVAFINLKKYKI